MYWQINTYCFGCSCCLLVLLLLLALPLIRIQQDYYVCYVCLGVCTLTCVYFPPTPASLCTSFSLTNTYTCTHMRKTQLCTSVKYFFHVALRAFPVYSQESAKKKTNVCVYIYLHTHTGARMCVRKDLFTLMGVYMILEIKMNAFKMISSWT